MGPLADMSGLNTHLSIHSAKKVSGYASEVPLMSGGVLFVCFFCSCDDSAGSSWIRVLYRQSVLLSCRLTEGRFLWRSKLFFSLHISVDVFVFLFARTNWRKNSAV